VRFTVTHEGVPIGKVELEIGARQGIGSLEPSPAYESIAPTLREVKSLGGHALVELLVLPVDEEPSIPALRPAAALRFELWDELGVYVPAAVVRLVDLQSRAGVTVFAEFGESSADVLARYPAWPLRPGSAQPLPDA